MLAQVKQCKQRDSGRTGGSRPADSHKHCHAQLSVPSGAATASSPSTATKRPAFSRNECPPDSERSDGGSGLVRAPPQGPVLGGPPAGEAGRARRQLRLLQRDAQRLGAHGVRARAARAHVLLHSDLVAPAPAAVVRQGRRRCPVPRPRRASLTAARAGTKPQVHVVRSVAAACSRLSHS